MGWVCSEPTLLIGISIHMSNTFQEQMQNSVINYFVLSCFHSNPSYIITGYLPYILFVIRIFFKNLYLPGEGGSLQSLE